MVVIVSAILFNLFSPIAINFMIYLQKSVQLSGISKISGALALLLKAAFQFILLIWFLCFKIPRPDVFVVQVRTCGPELHEQ